MIRSYTSRIPIIVPFTFVILLALPYTFSSDTQNSAVSPSFRVDRLALEVERINAVRAVK